ncbi:MAG: hypothetical protein Q8R53_04600 [Nanoarchaeota archaeon]|nr:hypothetical protein [Nanoarchaeota archaeon]
MRPEEVKKKIREIVGEQIEFEGHFEIVVEHIPENLQFHLISWVKECSERKQEPFPVPLQRNILVFFFKPNVTNVRGILKKEKNSFFIALFLDKHKYYDRERRKMGF